MRSRVKITKWKKIGAKTLFTGRITLEEWQMLTYQGKEHSFTIQKGKNIVMVLGVTENGKLVVIRQFYVALGQKVWSTVAGMVDGRETTLRAARREFEEETGYAAKKYVFLGTSAKGKYATGLYYFYLALGARPVGNQSLEDAEDIQVYELSSVEFARRLGNRDFAELGAELLGFRAMQYCKKRRDLFPNFS